MVAAQQDRAFRRCLAARKVLLVGIPPIVLWLGFAWWMNWLAHCASCAVR
jgi:hypothetical protein